MYLELQRIAAGTRFALPGGMRDLAKTIVIVSVATLVGLSASAEAKESRKHKAKRALPSKVTAPAAAAATSTVPWYEQGLDDLSPVVKTKARPAPTRAPAMPISGPRYVKRQTRTTLAPSGECQEGCDKTARNIHMATLVLVKDAKPARSAKPSSASRAATRSARPGTGKDTVVASKK